jgi:hypothetical protein
MFFVACIYGLEVDTTLKARRAVFTKDPIVSKRGQSSKRVQKIQFVSYGSVVIRRRGVYN